MTDPNNASIADAPFNKPGYALDPNTSRYTFGVWQFLRTDPNTGTKTNFDYYATLSVDRDAITGNPGSNPKVYLRIVKKSTGAEVYTRELNAGDSNISLPSYITNNAAGVTNTLTYVPANGPTPGTLTFSLVHANLEYETLQVRDTELPGNENEDKPNVQTTVPFKKPEQITYYREIDESKYTEGQPYKPTGDEEVITKYVQNGISGQQYNASDNRDIEKYERIEATTDNNQPKTGLVKHVAGQKLVELKGGANHYYVKRISETVDSKGSTITKFYALDPSEVDNFNADDIGSTDVSKYTLLYTTKVNAPGEEWKAESNINLRVNSKNGDYHIDIVSNAGDKSLVITGWQSNTEKVTLISDEDKQPRQYDKPFTKAPDASLTPSGKGNNSWNLIAGRNADIVAKKKVTNPDGSISYTELKGFTSFSNNYSVPTPPNGSTDVNYYFRKLKGEVEITYVDDKGNKLQDPKKDTPKSPYDTPYDTTEEGEKPNTIEKDGKTYKLVPKGDYPVGKVDENGHLVSSDPITGKVDKPKSVITYVYKEVKEDPVQPKGNVYVHYKDTEGNELKASVKDMDQQPVDSDYDTVVDNRPAEIEKDGKTYVLVPAGNYTVGEVDNQGHLKSSDPTTGKVAEQDKNVTYIYKLKEDPTPQPQPDPAQPKGNVYVHYKDTEGNELKTSVKDMDQQPVDSDYDTVVDNRPQEIVKDGKTYVLVPAGNYTVGEVDNQGHLKSSDPTTGKVAEQDKNVTYIYKLKEDPTPQPQPDPAQPKGNVYVHYKDTEGNELKTSVKDMDQQPVDSDYDTVVDNRPQEIVKDGKTYVLVPAGNYTVGEVDNQGHLKSSDPTTGKVAEQDKNVTYIYKLKEDPTPQPQPDPAQPKGNVYVHYKDTEGNELKTSVKDMDQQPVDSDYDTVVDNRPQEIVKDGKTYVLVPAGNYTVGEVDNQGHLKSSDPTTGKVAEQDKNVTYIYKLKEDPTPQPQPDPAQPKGNVYVHYKDTEGNELKTSVKDM
ncbi:MAG: MucBP domain-containing protein, partial [Peptostreptococcus sp.]|nr:MucBP domain-containing protein [Peptostreptococcus sp.]